MPRFAANKWSQNNGCFPFDSEVYEARKAREAVLDAKIKAFNASKPEVV